MVQWSTSTDQPNHHNWIQHWENQNANDVLVTGAPPIMSDGNPYGATTGNSVIAATGWADQLVLVSLAGSTVSGLGRPTDVVMAISNDAGNSFKNLIVLTNVCDQNAAIGVDQPKVVMEQQTHVAYVVWGSNRTGNWRGWMSRVHFGKNDPLPTSFASPIDMQLPQSFRNAVNFMNVAPVCDVAHQNSDNCSGGTEHIFLSYPALGPSSSYWPRQVGTNPVDCGPGDFDPIIEDIEWVFNYGMPGAWGPTTTVEDAWNPVCAIPEIVDGHGVQGSRGLGGPSPQPGNLEQMPPTMAFDTKTQKLHVLLTLSQYWHHPGNPPDFRGTRINHVIMDSTLFPTIEELAPVTIAGPPSGATSCTQVHPDDECFVYQMATGLDPSS